MKIGDIVTYQDVNLQGPKGKIEQIKGDRAFVRWRQHPSFLSEWLLRDLMLAE